MQAGLKGVPGGHALADGVAVRVGQRHSASGRRAVHADEHSALGFLSACLCGDQDEAVRLARGQGVGVEHQGGLRAGGADHVGIVQVGRDVAAAQDGHEPVVCELAFAGDLPCH